MHLSWPITYPTLLWHPVAVAPFEFRRDLWYLWYPCAILQRRLRDPTFSRLDTTPACEGQTDGRTHDNG